MIFNILTDDLINAVKTITDASKVVNEAAVITIARAQLPKNDADITKVTDALGALGHGTMWDSKTKSILVSPTAGRNANKDIEKVLKQFSESTEIEEAITKTQPIVEANEKHDKIVIGIRKAFKTAKAEVAAVVGEIYPEDIDSKIIGAVEEVIDAAETATLKKSLEVLNKVT